MLEKNHLNFCQQLSGPAKLFHLTLVYNQALPLHRSLSLPSHLLFYITISYFSSKLNCGLVQKGPNTYSLLLMLLLPTQFQGYTFLSASKKYRYNRWTQLNEKKAFENKGKKVLVDIDLHCWTFGADMICLLSSTAQQFYNNLPFDCY